MKIAVIPARGGSTRIANKNIKDFCGKPIIAYSIRAAIDSNCFDRVIVSSNNNEIINIAQQYGAEALFVRPESLSNDYIGTVPVIKHAIEECEKILSTQLSKICCIYATAPFIQPLDIKNSLDILEKNRCFYTFPVTSYPFPIQRAVKITPDKKIEMFQPDKLNTRSQDLEAAYHDAGQFYWGTRDAWLGNKPIFSSESMPVILPRNRVQDIDTLEDWECAELLFESLLKKNK